MNALAWVNTIIVAFGLPAIAGGLVFLGRKLEIIDSIKKDIDVNLRPDIQNVRERMATLEGRTSALFQSNSPISLTAKGRQYLHESGLKDFIDSQKLSLMEQCDHKRSMKTAYDIQQIAFAFFDELDLPEDLEITMKNVAFNQGITLGELRRTGGIYFRDLCLKHFGFSVSHIQD